MDDKKLKVDLCLINPCFGVVVSKQDKCEIIVGIIDEVEVHDDVIKLQGVHVHDVLICVAGYPTSIFE